MFSGDKILKETSPLSIFFVKSGSGGNKLLFRYPYDENLPVNLGYFASNQQQRQFDHQNSLLSTIGNNIGLNNDRDFVTEQDRLQSRSIINENDEALCNMFSVNPNLCGQKFEIKINSVRHVGHPMSLLQPSINSKNQSTIDPVAPKIHTRQNHQQLINQSSSPYDRLSTSANKPNNHPQSSLNRGDITSFNIVCALRASASYDIVDCYHDLSKRLAIALSFEERRSSYLSNEIKTILATMDERDMANLANQEDQSQQQTQQHLLHKNNSSSNVINNGIHDNELSYLTSNDPSSQDRDGAKSVFSLILERSNLAKDLKKIFISLSTTGVVDLKINHWVSLSFCLPQKVHRLKLLSHKAMPAIGTKDIKRCLLYLRPYHGLLLLYEQQELLNSLPIDASPAFIQLIKVTKPNKNFMDLSVDANLSLMQIFSIVSQLIYWAKATVIYPICDSNIYAIHPLASTGLQSSLVYDFKTRFPTSKSLHHYLADFSEGTSLSQLNGPLLNLEEKSNLLSIVTWLLQRRILTQIHKYIFLVVDKETNPSSLNEDQTMTRTHKAIYNQDQQQQLNQFSPNSIEISVPMNNANSNQFHRGINGFKQASSIDSPPQMFKNSFSESFESSLRRYRTDSLPESQEDSNFNLNSSLSSTPNSNLEYPSPNNDGSNSMNNNQGGFSLSSSCPLDNPITIHNNQTASILTTLQQAGLSLSAAKNVLSIPSSRNPDDLKLLVRLSPYFDGKHHVEDVMFFENLERSQVLILCDKFRDILFTCHYEDVAVSQLSPFDTSTK